MPRLSATLTGAALGAATLLAAAGDARAAACVFNPDLPFLKRLTASCETTQTITIPNGGLFDGQGFTITALDPPGGAFQGAILQNAGPVALVNNVRLRAQGLATSCKSGNARLAGIRYDAARGSITNVQILSLFQANSGCQEGTGIEVRSAPFDGTHPATKQVTITNVSVQDYQKTGIIANGDVAVNLSLSNVGRSTNQANLSANAVQFGFGGRGTVSNTTISGNQNLIPGGADGSTATAVILFQAPDVILASNNIRGNANIAVYVESSPRANVTNNQIIDEGADAGSITDDIGVFVEASSRPGSRVQGNVIQCYTVPVEIEGAAAASLGVNRVLACGSAQRAAKLRAERALARAPSPARP